MPRNTVVPALLLSLSIALLPVSSPAQTDAPPAATAMEVNVVNPEDLLHYSKTVMVPTAYVTLLAGGRATASKQSGLFQRGNASALASANFRVAGIDKAFAQSLAQLAYDDFVGKLRAAGYTVLTYADVREREFMRNAQREKGDGALGLPTKSEGGHTYVTAAPTDDQHFRSGFAGGVFAEFLQGGKSLVTDATLIIPQYTITAPQIWGESSRGYASVSAEIKTAPGMNLTFAAAHWAGKPVSRVMRGIPGVQTRQQVVNITGKAGTLQHVADTTPQAANALSNVLSALSGAGNTQRSSGEYLFTIDREAYAAGMMNGIGRFNAEVAKAAADAKPD